MSDWLPGLADLDDLDDGGAVGAGHPRHYARKEASMDFGKALSALKDGKKVTRSGWNGRGMWIALQRPDQNSKMSLPYVYMRTAQGDLVPWLASQTDVLAEDWALADGA